MTAEAVPDQESIAFWGEARCAKCKWAGPRRVYGNVAKRDVVRHNQERHPIVMREAARSEALRMWPEAVHLGKYDGIVISSDRALLIQRQAFEMGVEWATAQVSHG